ncbi:MAG: TatD family deoxyribonuclease [Dehalococcoidia bacterium]|nr:TatD family deoxyribonuclease [Dehalococcoidia bacterium]
MPPLIDTHCHLDAYTTDDEVGEVLARARSVGVRLIVNAGTTVESSQRCVELTKTFAELYAGVGIHPMDLTSPVDEDIYSQLLRHATSTDKVIVISEIGLDFLDNMPDRAMQYQAFREQIRLARELQMPIVFHSREAHDEVLRVLREERAYEVGGAMHYFQGDMDTARAAIDLGFYISLAKPLLRLPHLQTVAANLPLDRIVLETDSAPQPFKAKRENWTEPRHLHDIAGKLAELRGIDTDEVRHVTSDNFLKMLGDRGARVRSAVVGECYPSSF